MLNPGIGAQSYYRPTSRVVALIYQTMYGGIIADAPSPCGPNCTFSQSFVAPTYQCSPTTPEYPDFLLGSPSDVSRVNWYRAWNTSADFCATMGDAQSCTFNTGDEWLAGIIRVDYVYLSKDQRDIWEADNSYAIPSSAWEYSGILCEQWFTRLEVQRTYSNSIQIFNESKV